MAAHRSEKGQVLLLIVLGMVGIMGFVGLAVDGSMLYAARRQAQNAVDTAAMAGAYAATEGKNINAAAIGLMVANGYDKDQNPAVDTSTRQDLAIFNPPVSGPYANAANKKEYIQVIYRTKLDQIFSQFVFMGQFEITVEAVAHYIPTDTMSAGNALHATGVDHCPGLVFNGGSTTKVSGGSIYSNSNGTDTSGSCASGEMTGTSGSIKVTGGGLKVSGSWIQNAGVSVSPAAVTNQEPIYLYEKTPPNCTGLTTYTHTSNPLRPGYYPNGIQIQNGDYTMQPGLYCLDGNFTVNGGSLYGQGVVIYMTPAGGGVNFSGSALVTLTTGGSVKDANGENFGGYLIFMDKANRNGVDMAGSNGTFYHGTIYAPGPRDPASQEKCNIGGANSSMALHSNIVCYSIGIAGNADVTITYKPEENYRMPPMVELSQ
jgi:hypothetical protein